MAKILNMRRKALLLAKPSGTIMIAGPLTELERKIYNGFLKVAHESLKKDPREHWFQVPLFELKELLRVKDKDKNNKYLKQAMRRMHKIDIEYNLRNKDERISGIASLLDNIYFNERENGYTIVRFSIPEMVRLSFVERGTYASIDLKTIRGLKSKYAIVIYEIICDYQAVEVPEMTIRELRRCVGIETKYPKIRDLRRRVLDPACSELNESPAVTFTVSYTLIKKGNRYTHIKFHHQPKPQAAIDIQPGEPAPLQVPEPETPFARLLALVPEKHRSKKTIRKALEKALKEHGKEYCERNIRYANQKANRNYRAFVCRALREDWALAWWEDAREKNDQMQILQSIKNARIRIGGEEYRADEDGFVFGKGSIIPPGEVVRLVIEHKAEVLGQGLKTERRRPAP